MAFGGFADSKCPLTLDHGALVEIVAGLEIPKPVRDRQGRVINAQSLQEELATAIGDGVAVGVDRLRGAKAKSKVLVLLTDGDNNAGVVDPREAAQIAQGRESRCTRSASAETESCRFPRKTNSATACWCRLNFGSMKSCCEDMAQTGGGRTSMRRTPGLAQVYAEIDARANSVRRDQVLGVFRTVRLVCRPRIGDDSLGRRLD